MRRWQVVVGGLFAAGALACGSAPSTEPVTTPPTLPDAGYQGVSPQQQVPTQEAELPEVNVAPQDNDDSEEGLGGLVCKDGSISHAQHRQGACSHHGGVA